MAELEQAEASRCEVAVSREDEKLVLTIAGVLDLSSTVYVRPLVDAALAGETASAVFDVSRLDFMDSSGLGLLLRVAQQVHVLELRDPSPIIRRLVELTGLSDTLRIVP